jgi:endonuclease YncB( thermonuclease family)
MRYITIGLLLFLLSPVGAFADFTGPVVSVLDGDTIEVLHNTHPERIRLSGIDCPEKGQAFGTRAKRAASALMFGKGVMLHTHGQDKYRRTLADVVLKDGTNVNHELVKQGWCWWYRKYAPGDVELEKLESEAREVLGDYGRTRTPCQCHGISGLAGWQRCTHTGLAIGRKQRASLRCTCRSPAVRPCRRTRALPFGPPRSRRSSVVRSCRTPSFHNHQPVTDRPHLDAP